MGGHKDIRRHTRTLKEDKATTWWGEGKDTVGLEQWRGGGAFVQGGSQELLSRCLSISGWIWGIQKVMRNSRVVSGGILGCIWGYLMGVGEVPSHSGVY